jgi:CDP-glycerol glycerophosphotransferase
VDRILESAGEAIGDELRSRLQNGVFVFGTVGRLSPEKGHERLIRAFAEVHKANPKSQLVIVGEGPERPRLEALVHTLGLERSVVLTGLLLNPYPVMRAFDCFVLSSIYEGQGIVVIEALTLGIPAVSTDIPGPRSLLENGVGLLVEDSVEGLAHGMTTVVEGRFVPRPFDARAYEADAYAMFERNLLALPAGSLEETGT